MISLLSAQWLVFVQRVLLAVVGSYLLSTGLASLGALWLAKLIGPSEATVFMAMLAFIIYLLLLLWAFAERRLMRLWILLGVGSAIALGSAYLLGAVDIRLSEADCE